MSPTTQRPRVPEAIRISSFVNLYNYHDSIPKCLIKVFGPASFTEERNSRTIAQRLYSLLPRGLNNNVDLPMRMAEVVEFLRRDHSILVKYTTLPRTYQWELTSQLGFKE